jgi:hypothetical protein
MKIVDRYKLANDSLYTKKKAVLDLIYGEDFDKIPIYLRPSSDTEINSILYEIDFSIFNDIDYATIMFVKELDIANDYFWAEAGMNWIYLKLLDF